jgi:Holliday junction DNA helicase RuvA
VIEYLSGTLADKHPTHVVVETAGIGYRVQIPLSSYAQLGEVGSAVKLVTHHHVREDSEELYGFATEEERALFRLLIDVSGIGPRLAQSILSGMPADALRDALGSGDLASLTRVPGVGRKTGERMILELRDKVARLVPAARPVSAGETPSNEDEEAVRALVTLGYGRFEAQRAVRTIREHGGPELPLAEVIRAAIQAAR